MVGVHSSPSLTYSLILCLIHIRIPIFSLFFYNTNNNNNTNPGLVGTNLGKLEMCGAKCHFFDVGGRMQALWERYYDDCDAVIFCWKLGEDEDDDTRPYLDHDDDDDDDDENDEEAQQTKNQFKQQQALLSQVRQAIPDDVPFLILGHVFGNINEQLVDQLYDTSLILPHYHNPMTTLCVASAKTGMGIPYCMEWLISIAKRQQRERSSKDAAPKSV